MKMKFTLDAWWNDVVEWTWVSEILMELSYHISPGYLCPNFYLWTNFCCVEIIFILSMFHWNWNLILTDAIVFFGSSCKTWQNNNLITSEFLQNIEKYKKKKKCYQKQYI